MDLGLAGKTAVVAGSTKGIGRATALALAREGMRVVVSGREQSVAEKVAREISGETKAQVRGIAADVATAPGAAKLIDGAATTFGGVDVLVTNAGGPKPGGFDELTDEDFLAGFQLNFMSTVRMIR